MHPNCPSKTELLTKIIRLARSVSARRQPEKVSQKLNDELLHRLGQLGVISGNSAGDNGVAGDLSQLLEQLANLSVVSAGDLECSVNEQICAVVVGSQDTGNEAVECVNALYCVVLDVDKANLRGDVGVEGRALLDSNNVAVGLVLCLVDSVDKDPWSCRCLSCL